jgi:hypothetical protein
MHRFGQARAVISNSDYARTIRQLFQRDFGRCRQAGGIVNLTKDGHRYEMTGHDEP